MKIDLKKLSTPVLIEIKRILTDGVQASAETYNSKGLKLLEAENEVLKRELMFREIVTSYGLDFDDDISYWMNHKDAETLERTCKMMSDIAKAEYSKNLSETLKVPPLFIRDEIENKTVADIIREGFNERKKHHQS